MRQCFKQSYGSDSYRNRFDILLLVHQPSVSSPPSWAIFATENQRSTPLRVLRILPFSTFVAPIGTDWAGGAVRCRDSWSSSDWVFHSTTRRSASTLSSLSVTTCPIPVYRDGWCRWWPRESASIIVPHSCLHVYRVSGRGKTVDDFMWKLTSGWRPCVDKQVARLSSRCRNLNRNNDTADNITPPVGPGTIHLKQVRETNGVQNPL